jgi:hypothetical protein
LQRAHRLAGRCRYAGGQHAARIPCYALATRKNPSVSSGTLWIGIGISHGPGYGIGNANPQLQRAVVLVFIGGKMLAAQWYHLPVHVSLGIVGLILLVAIAASLVRPARHSA